VQGLKNILLKEHLLVFMFCIAVLTGPAVATLFQYDLSRFPDCATYLGLAHFDFHQNLVRRYRVLIPFTAAAINFLFGRIFGHISPSYFTGNYSLSFSFLVINMVLTAYFGLLIYRYCRAFGASKLSSIIGILVMLTCRYTIYMVAFPLVDSFFCVIVAWTLLGIKLKNTSMLVWAIFIGPFAKESFIFIAPLIFFFSHLGKGRMLLYFSISAVLFFGFRYIYDIYTMGDMNMDFRTDLGLFSGIFPNLKKLFSIYTLFKIIMNTGWWVAAPVFVLLVNPAWDKQLLASLDKYLVYFIASVLLQMLLSGSMERMFYLAMPVICVIVALSTDELTKLYIRVVER